MTRKISILLLVVFMFSLISCAKVQQAVSDIENMTPKQKTTWMMGVYNAQYDDYRAKASLLDLTEEEKKILRTKKMVLLKVYPLIESYDMLVSSGSTPSKDKEARILGMLTELQNLSIRMVANI